MHIKLYVQISPDWLGVLRPGSSDFIKNLMTYASFSTHKHASYIQLGEAELDIDILVDPSQIAVAGAAALRIKQADIRAKAQKECNDVEKVINQLLAIENKPTAPDPVAQAKAIGIDVHHDDDEPGFFYWSKDSDNVQSGLFDTAEAAAIDAINYYRPRE